VALDREYVVRAALDLLDQVGLDGLTLRKLAAELGVQAPALYWHFANKQELLDHMAAAIMEDARGFDVEDGVPWDVGLREYAFRQRRALLSHRDGARVALGNRPMDSTLPVIERAMARLTAVGFTPVQAMRGMVTLSTFVGGFATEEQAEAGRNQAEGWTEADDHAAFQALLDNNELSLLVEALRMGGDPNGEDTFVFGVQLIIDGLRALLARQGDLGDAVQ